MVTIITLDGRSYAIRNEQYAAMVLHALPHFVPVDFNPAITDSKESPKVQDRAIRLDITAVHDIAGLKRQVLEKNVDEFARRLEERFGIRQESGGAGSLFALVLDKLADFDNERLATAMRPDDRPDGEPEQHE